MSTKTKSPKAKKTQVLSQQQTDRYAIYNGDSVELIKALPDASVGMSVFSPPFSSLYTYSASDRDMGNCAGDDEFAKHFDFLVKDLFRVMQTGRLVAIHCMNLPTSKANDGYIGIKDFRGDLIRMFQSHGFIYHSEVCIWKDPIIAMQRTKALGLLHKQVVKDSCMSRQGIPDYLVVMRKPGANDNPVSGPFDLDEFAGTDKPSPCSDRTRDSINVWQRYASPVWMDINPGNTLQYMAGRHKDDNRHICLARDSRVLTRNDGYKPIQDVNIGDLVLTHKGRWMPVIAKQKTSDSADVVSVNAGGVSNLTLTPDHKLWARDSNSVTSHHKQKAMSMDPEWIKAEDLGKSYLNLQLPPIEYSDLTAQEWWIIGRWIADGHLHTRSDDGRTSLHISGGNHKLDCLMDNLGEYAGSTHSPGSSCTQVRIKDPARKLRDVIERCGKYAHLKQIPVEAYGLDKELAASFLDGYLSGDGHFQEDRKRWYLTSASKDLLMGLQFIVQRVYGVTSTLHAGRGDREIVIEGRVCQAKQEWVMSFQTHGYSFNFVDDMGAWKKVKSVANAGMSETWNIRVMEDASYTAEGCIVKNCPLQLDVIHRAIDLWSNPDDIVFTPFMGIGSEVYQALKMGRRAIGFELKPSYYDLAKRNIGEVADQINTSETPLLDLLNGGLNNNDLGVAA
jgi:hypothetical protein